MKSDLKTKAVRMRRAGMTYSEILHMIPVAKSTLSLWFKEVSLSKPQKQAITEKRLMAALRGAHKRRDDRLARSEFIRSAARREVGTMSQREMWLIGIALYWAEGTKEKSYRPGGRAEFTNSDATMVKLYVCWLESFCGVKRNEIAYEIYIHEQYAERLDDVRKFWSEATGFPLRYFNTIYFKRHNVSPIRKNIGNEYNGNLRVRVRKSSTLLRKIAGWTEGISNNYCRVV